MRKIIRNNLEYKLNFAKHIEEICQKATRKLYAIARLAPYMTPSKIHILTNVFYKFQFKYSPLIWMCCNRSLIIRSSRPEVFLGKGVLKIYSKFTGEHPCRSAISIKLLCNFVEMALLHGCSLVNLLHIFRTSFLKNTIGRLLLNNRINRLHERCLRMVYDDKKLNS